MHPFPLVIPPLTAYTSLSASHQQDPQPPDNTLPYGSNPISIKDAEFLGEQKATNSCSHRDLGFTGQLGGKWYSIFGDTLFCQPGTVDPKDDSDGFHGMVRDSISLLTDDPLVVVDLNLNDDQPVRHQRQFIPFNPDWDESNIFGFGGTSLVETDPASSTGAVYYLVNANTSGLRGAGVAKVELVDDVPTVTHRYGANGIWWDAETQPRYGDIAAYRDVNSDYVYVWGNPPGCITDWGQCQYIYQARVKAADAFDLSKYEYWWGRQKGWKQNQPLTTFNTETAVMWGAGQGQVVYSPYYQCYIYVHLGFGDNTVYLKTAPAPEGPWSAGVKVYTTTPIDGGLVYAGVAHPYLDESGQTLVISYTNNNHIEVIRATFSK